MMHPPSDAVCAGCNKPVNYPDEWSMTDHPDPEELCSERDHDLRDGHCRLKSGHGEAHRFRGEFESVRCVQVWHEACLPDETGAVPQTSSPVVGVESRELPELPHYLGEVVVPNEYRRTYSLWECPCGKRSINYVWEPVVDAPDGTARCVRIYCKRCGDEPFGQFTVV